MNDKYSISPLMMRFLNSSAFAEMASYRNVRNDKLRLFVGIEVGRKPDLFKLSFLTHVIPNGAKRNEESPQIRKEL